MFTVYKITNAVNGKCYIGITSRHFNERFKEHLWRINNEKRDNRLIVAMRKYGKENFSIEKIDETDSEDHVRQLEKEYIIKYDTYENGYNCNFGGCGFLEFPEHIKRKMSLAQKGRINSEETRKKMSAAKLGDSKCAKNFGKFTKKGVENPKSRKFKIQFPDGRVEIICGIRQFCRDNNLTAFKLKHAKSTHKGFKILERL